MKSKFTRGLMLTLYMSVFAGIQCINAQFVSNGSASCNGDCCTLTVDQPALSGNIFSANTIDLNFPFQLDAVLNFGCKDASGADGIVFVFTTNNSVIGVGGGGIGYQGITPSVAVEIDTYQNGNLGDPAADHLAIMTNGSVDHLSGNNLVGPLSINNVEDCKNHCFTLTWDPSSLTLTATIDDFTISYFGDIRIFTGNLVYYGFTGSTGGLSNLQTVCFNQTNTIVPMADITICEGESVQLQADPSGSEYRWQNDATLNNLTISNPLATPTSTRTYVVTITKGCEEVVDDVRVTVVARPNILLNSNEPVCEGAFLQLFAITDGNTYQWTGPNGFVSSDANTFINPARPQNSGTYTLTVSNSFGCTNSAQITVTVQATPTPAIIAFDQPLCIDESPFYVYANPEGGVWSGAADQNGLVNPANIGPGLHRIWYEYTSPIGCTGSTEYDFIINLGPQASISQSLTLCEDQLNGSYTLPVFISGRPGFILDIEINGVLQSINIANTGTYLLPVLEGGTYLLTDIRDQSGCRGGVSGIGEVRVLNQAELTIDQIECDEDLESYQVTFSLGQFINLDNVIFEGEGGSLEASGNGTYILAGIPSGSEYHWIIFDNFACDTLVLQGQLQCACTTIAGDIESSRNTYCTGDSVVITHTGNYVLADGDVLIFICHDGDEDSIGNILATNTTGKFFFEEGMEYGRTYYIQAVVGNMNFINSQLFQSPCVSLSNPIPIVFYSIAELMIIEDELSACEGDLLEITVRVETLHDFSMRLSGLAMDQSINGMSGEFKIPLSASVSGWVFAQLTNDGTGLQCPGNLVDSAFIVLYPHITETFQLSICEGDSIEIAGIYRQVEGVYQIENQSMYGCDSISIFQLSIHPTDYRYTYGRSCRPEDTGIFYFNYSNNFGCDSTVVLEVLFSEADTSYLQFYTCEYRDPDTLVLSNQYLCDSLLITNYIYTAPDITEISVNTCDEYQWSESGDTYNQSGRYEKLYQNYLGCDSLFILQLTVYPSYSASYDIRTCEEFYWQATGETYYQSGTYPLSLQSSNGCDSIIILNLQISEEILTEESYRVCDKYQWQVSGDEYTISGIYQQNFITAQGCDSIHVLDLTIYPSKNTALRDEACEEYLWTTDGSRLIQSGIYTFNYQTTHGCDSIVTLDLRIEKPDTIIQIVSTGSDYLWDIDNRNYTESGIYTHVNQEGLCDLVYILRLEVKKIREVYLPNIFRPDAGNRNGRVFASASLGIDLIDALSIYDRWGNLMFHNENFTPNIPEEGWDGRSRSGSMAVPGVYVCKLIWTDDDGEKRYLLQDVTLVR